MTLVEKINAYTTQFGFGQARVHSSVDNTVLTLTLRNGESVRLPREPEGCPDDVLTIVAGAAGAFMEASAQAATAPIVERAFNATNGALVALSALTDGPGVAWAKGVTASLRRRVAALDTAAG